MPGADSSFSRPESAAARKHALVIGIGRYLPGQGIQDLDGPGPDAEAVAATLIADFGFPTENVRLLRDSQASRSGILEALDQLIVNIAPGDYLLIYYSGHAARRIGFAGYADRCRYGSNHSGGLPPRLFPRDRRAADGSASGPAAAFQKLDRKAAVFGILDTCFSANLMRNVRVRGKPKGVLLGQLLANRVRSMDEEILQDIEKMEQAPPPAPYPYQTVAWISAALAGQQAMDIDRIALERDRNATIDGKPHGVLTNSVLTGLRGQADLNRDGVVTHAELYDYLLRQSMTWSHQPSWSAAKATANCPSCPSWRGEKHRSLP